MSVLVLFGVIITHNNKIYKIAPENLTIQELMLKEALVDWTIIGEFLYALTEKSIYCIDTNGLKILDRTPLPQRFNCLTIGKDEVFLISSSEIIILNRKNLAFKSGIGIESGDYEVMGLSPKKFLYLISNDNKKSIIKIIDLTTGKRIKSAVFKEIKKFYYTQNEERFLILTDSGIYSLDLNLGIKESIKLNFPKEDFFLFGDNYIITNKQGIFLIDKDGWIMDFQPVLLSRSVRNNSFVFFNKDEIVLIDPLTIRIMGVLKNEKEITDIYKIDYSQSLCVDKNGETFLLDGRNGSMKNLIKMEYHPTTQTVAEPVLEDSLFYLQFGAFSDFRYAQKFNEDLRKSGLPVFIDSTEDKLYRIKLGGFVDKELSQEIMENCNFPGYLVFHKKVDCPLDTIFSFKQKNYHLKNGVIEDL
uniref:SPOR domain-containing protein n=1 Tax=candidate division WOR-3 bacterium TaxID=2052148 RepID=A0A7C4TBF4_UNCW3